jgi:hypothetical protein
MKKNENKMKYPNEGKPWKPEDDLYLMTSWKKFEAKKMTPKEIAYDLGRTVKAIQSRHSILKKEHEINKMKTGQPEMPLMFKLPKGRKSGKGHEWSKEERTFMKDVWGFVSIDKMTNRLDRSPIAIHSMGIKTGLPKIYPDPRYNPFFVPIRHGWNPGNGAEIKFASLKDDAIPVTNGLGETVDQVDPLSGHPAVRTNERCIPPVHVQIHDEVKEENLQDVIDEAMDNMDGKRKAVPCKPADDGINGSERIVKPQPEGLFGQSLIVDSESMEKAHLMTKVKSFFKVFFARA